MLSDYEKKEFTENILIPNFMHLVDQGIYSVLFDYELKIVVCTTLSAQSIGLERWEDARGLSFRNYANTDVAAKIFSGHYNEQLMESLHQYAKRIYEIQRLVFTSKNVISLIDLLPYGGKFTSYLVTYVPILHPSGEVVAIQSFAIQSRFFSHQDYLKVITDEKTHERYLNSEKLTLREHEIMFLLANGVNQEQCSQILKITRSTIGNIIANQLCPKFGILGSNTKLLAQVALQHEFHQLVPSSLYRPYIVVLDEKIATQINNYTISTEPPTPEIL
ncbi:MAG TPA: hypothetical protein PLP75_13615 [Burkholderiales bacterium]|jgi:hypothetical protein|nr:hypothetical protein [Burkholderiales bacterium]